ncbi:MAG: thiamine-monophosphate kinase [Actinomycetota bacterium]|nr:thiamine-monophosphate kinase [Actinomycetota bacterium]
MPPGDEPVSSLGESGLLERVFAKLPSAPSGEIWSGDDAAVITVGDSSCLLTTDAIVEGVDFELTSASGYDIGWKAIAVNASDIAAMGGRPTRAVATLYLRPDHAVELVDDVLSGLLAGADRYGLAIVGGDVTEAAELAVSIALLGDVGANGPVLRSGAMAGESLWVTGTLGGARAGHLVLTGAVDADRDDPEVARCIKRQLRPTARIEAGRVLGGVATAMIDLSDGLALDLQRLLDASGVSCIVEASSIPIDPAIAALDLDPLETAIVGGEDFELLFTANADELDHAIGELATTDTKVARIGTITAEGEGATIGDRSLADWTKESWDHLRPR